jgi:hypothetical protein
VFKWPGVPSPSATRGELADYAELVCWQQGNTSETELVQDIGRLDDNDYSDGVPEEEETQALIEEAYLEIERRIEACPSGYPFVVDEKGHTLLVRKDAGGVKHVIYRYLLLATRLNMNINRVHAGLDGALLLEELAAETSREYLGARAESIVFGTAEGTTGFSDKVDDLCRRLEEGGGFMNHGGGPLRQKDGKLDVVAWKAFTDRRVGKLIAFGQCKTGTNWRDQVTQLQTDSFCSNWFQSQPVLTPIRMFFISEALPNVGWRNDAVYAGLLFDRCRIVDFCDEISQNVLEKIASWTKDAAHATELPGP